MGDGGVPERGVAALDRRHCEMKVRLGGVFERLLRRLRRNERAAIVVEFALVLPVLIMIFVGMAEFTEAFTVMRKLAQSAGTVSDLVAQETTVTTSTLANIRLIAEEIMKPYSPPDSLVIVSVVSDAANTVRVEWSDPPIYAKDQTYQLPNDKLTEPNSGLIVTEATYNFTPTLSYFLLGNFTLQERAFFRPRSGKTIPKAN
jgi:Flp pilus assembly protein TadG